MIVKVMKCTSSVKNPFFYNWNKVETGEAIVIGINNIPSATFGDIYRTLRYQESLAIRTKAPSIHIMISADKEAGEFITDEQAVELAGKIMKESGLGNLPYVIFRHEDTDKIHYHIVSTKIMKDGKSVRWNGIGQTLTYHLMQHEKEYGYVAGQHLHQTKIKEAKQGRNAEIRQAFRESLQDTSFTSLEEYKKLMRGSNLDIRRKQSRHQNVRHDILAINRIDENGKRIGRPVYLTSDETAKLDEQIEIAKVKKLSDMITGYNSIIPPMCRGEVSLISVKNKAYQLMKAATDAGIAVSKETTEKFGELKNTWKEFDRLNQEARATKDAADKTEALGGLLMLLNPILGLTVLFLTKVSNDIRQAEIKAQKKQLLARVVSIRSEISQLQEQKAQLKIEKQERLQEYMEAKQMLKEYNDGLQTVDREVKTIESELHADAIRQYTQSDHGKALLAKINRSFDDTHYSLVPGPLVETGKGMRWELYTDGFRGSGHDDLVVHHKQNPASQKYGESYVDFSFNEEGHLIASVECDPTNYYTYGISGVLNIETGEGSVVRRDFRGTAEEERRRKQKNRDNYAKFQSAGKKKPKEYKGTKW